MQKGTRLVLAVVAVSLLAAALSPFTSSKSSNPCLDCHQNYNMYLDILEGAAGNTMPTALKDGETLTVAVVIKVTSNSPTYKMISAITATLASQNGFFSVASPTCSVGSLSKGQTATASWKIRPLASGTDVMSISAQGVNQHGPTYYSDSYSPSPSIAVERLATDITPTIALSAPGPGQRFSGGADIPVSWVVEDDNRSTCRVDLYYSTDDFKTLNGTIATGLQAGQGYTWNAPRIDSTAVQLKATVTDKNGNFNEALQDGYLAIDSTPPSVLAVLPADKAKDVADSAIIQVKFSEPVAEGGAQAAFSISPDPGGVAWAWSPEHSTMTATHDPFRAKTTYTCTISSGLKDLSSPGNVESGTFSWSFTTPDVIIPAPSIILSAPAGGDRFYWGDRTTIRWTASGGTGTLAINLSISQNDTAGPFLPVASGVSNSGQHAFTIPPLLSDLCIVEATACDLNGKEARSASGVFSIVQNLSLVADFPPSGIPLLAGNATSLNWTSTGGHGAVSVNLSFLPDANSTAQAILSGLPGSGERSWTLPEANTGSARLVLNATDEWGRSVEISSGPLIVFTKDPPPVLRPNRQPVVLFNLLEARVSSGVQVTFDASGSFDPDGDSLYYIWDFGDGTQIENTTTPTSKHAYRDGGDYTTVLAVGDTKNETVQAMVVHVAAAPAQNANRDEWLIIMFGMFVIFLGCAGVVFSAAARPVAASTGRPSGTTRAAASGDRPAAEAAPLLFDRDRCEGCGACSRVCPEKAIVMISGPPGSRAPGKKMRKQPKLDGSKCTGCGECVKDCVREAIVPGPAFKRGKGS